MVNTLIGVVIWALAITGVYSLLTGDDTVGQEEQVLSEFMADEVVLPVEAEVYETPYSTPYATPVQNCHPSYSGCLNPNASDYDCAGGSGNGPYYTGMVQVYGYDEFDLDRDGDGLGCE